MGKFQNFVSPTFQIFWHLPHPKFRAPCSKFGILNISHIQIFWPLAQNLLSSTTRPYPKFLPLAQNLLSSTSPISKILPLAQNLLSSTTTRPHPKFLPPCSEFIIFNYSPTSKIFAPRPKFSIFNISHIQNFGPWFKICYLQHLPYPKFLPLAQNLLSSTTRPHPFFCKKHSRQLPIGILSACSVWVLRVVYRDFRSSLSGFPSESCLDVCCRFIGILRTHIAAASLKPVLLTRAVPV